MKFLFRTLILTVPACCLMQTAHAQDPVKLAPDKYKVILNNDRVRVVDARLKPGDKTPMHSHPTYLLYSFTNSSVKFTSKDGKTTNAKIRAGECMWKKAETHAVENTGKNDVHVLQVEFKR